MTTIVTRSGKAAPLTNTELDTNFTNLNTDKLEKGSNLSDLQSVSQARTNLGLGDLATQSKASLAGPVVLTDSSTSPALKITQTGTGNALVVEDAASDTTPFVIVQYGNVGVGVSTAFANNKLSVAGGTDASTWLVRSSADNTGYEVRLLKNRNTNVYANTVVNSSDILGAVSFGGNDGTNYQLGASIQALVDGTPGSSDIPGRLVFSTTSDGASSPTERLRIDSSGNVLVKSAAGLGYGTGAGGQVTQVTSKSTAVTLNTPSGQITMHNAALAAGAEVFFTVNNSLVTANDLVVLNANWNPGAAYFARVYYTTGGAFNVSVKNMTANPLSDAVVLNFAIIKGAAA